MNKTVVIALGGNAISSPQGVGTLAEQWSAVERSCREIAEVIHRGYRVVFTHGNGPQVGNLLIQQEAAKELVPAMPLDICGAMTQGQLGYLIQQKLSAALQARRIAKPVATVITRVRVDAGDRAFRVATKPIGPFYSESERLQRVGAYSRGEVTSPLLFKKVGRGAKPWRRVVASPEPQEILEIASIRALMKADVVVIACGGGGVPVVQRDVVGAYGNTPLLEGVEAVIDKDLASALLAQELGADALLLLTDVPGLAIHFGTPQQRFLDRLSTPAARRYLAEGHFPPGSMGPKVEAAVRFIESGGARAVIANLEQALAALEGRAGTTIY